MQKNVILSFIKKYFPKIKNGSSLKIRNLYYLGVSCLVISSTTPVTMVSFSGFMCVFIFPFPLNGIFLLALVSPDWSIWLISDSIVLVMVDLTESDEESRLNPSNEGCFAACFDSWRTWRNLLFFFCPWCPLLAVLWCDPWWPTPWWFVFVVSPWWWWWWWWWL